MDAKAVLDVISTGGALGIAGLIIVGFLMGWLHTKAELDDKDESIAYERGQKEVALGLAKGALELVADLRNERRNGRHLP